MRFLLRLLHAELLLKHADVCHFSFRAFDSDHSGSELGSPNISQAERQKTHSKLYLAGPTRPPRVGKTREEREKEKKEKEQKEKAKRDAKEKEKEKEKEGKDKDSVVQAGVLRKRTVSGDTRTQAAPTGPPSQPNSPGGALTGAITLRPGENVLKQLKEIVGEPDHSGFMLKKGERYNTWKNRFFFLKGPHIYYLRGKQVSDWMLVMLPGC